MTEPDTEQAIKSRALAPSRPKDAQELRQSLRAALADPDLLGAEANEYAAGRYFVAIEDQQLEFAIIADERIFPWIRLDHEVGPVSERDRESVLDLTNGLTGRSSTLGAHWWLGETALWQVGAHWGGRFDPLNFSEQFQQFVQVATDRTSELRTILAMVPWPDADTTIDRKDETKP